MAIDELKLVVGYTKLALNSVVASKAVSSQIFTMRPCMPVSSRSILSVCARLGFMGKFVNLSIILLNE